MGLAALSGFFEGVQNRTEEDRNRMYEEIKDATSFYRQAGMERLKERRNKSDKLKQRFASVKALVGDSPFASNIADAAIRLDDKAFDRFMVTLQTNINTIGELEEFTTETETIAKGAEDINPLDAGTVTPTAITTETEKRKIAREDVIGRLIAPGAKPTDVTVDSAVNSVLGTFKNTGIADNNPAATRLGDSFRGFFGSLTEEQKARKAYDKAGGMLGKSGEELEALLGDDLEYTPTTSGDIVRLGIEDPAQQLDRATKRLQQETARIDLELKRIQTEADGNIEERTGMDGKSLGPMSSYAYGQYLNRQKVIAQTMVDLSQVNDPKWKRADINGLNNNLMKGIMPYGSKAGFTQLPDGTIITTAQASTLDNALGIIAQATGAELFKENKGTSKGGILDLLASSVDPKQVFQEAARLYRDGNQTITDAIDNNKDVQTIFNKRLGANWKEGAVGPAKPNPKEDKDGETTEEVDTRTEKEQAEQAENTAVGGVDGTTVDPAKAQEIARAEEIEAEDRKNAQKAEALQNKAFDIAAGQSPDKPIALRLNEYLTRLHKQKGFEWVPRDRSGRAKLVDAYISDSNIESFAETDADRLNQAFKIIARR
jgi:hypothetical protein